MVGYVRCIHISPEADCAREILPHTLIFPHAFLAVADEGFEAVFLNLLLAVDAEHLFNLKLNGETVSIPACLTGYHIALHCAVSGNHILDNSGQNVTDVGFAVCGGRAVIEGVGGAALSGFDASLENLIFFPEFKHSFFSFDEIKIR